MNKLFKRFQQAFLGLLIATLLLPQGSFAAFSIVDDTLDQEQHTLISEGFEPIMGEILTLVAVENPVVDPEPEEPTPTPPVVSGGGSGSGRGRHHVASWFLAKKYKDMTGEAYGEGDLANLPRENEEPRYDEEWHTVADDVPTPEEETKEEVLPEGDVNIVIEEIPEIDIPVASVDETDKEVGKVISETDIAEEIINIIPETEVTDATLPEDIDLDVPDSIDTGCSSTFVSCALLEKENKEFAEKTHKIHNSLAERINMLEEKIQRNQRLVIIGGAIQFLILIFIIGYVLLLKDDKKRPPRKKSSRKKHILMILLVFLGTGFSFAAHAENGALRYQGRIKDDQGAYAVGDYTFRFSMWQNPNAEVGDISNGEININAVHYLGWQEQKPLILETGDEGLFLFFLGSANPLPTDLFTGNNHVYLHVDVKTTGQPDSTYEQIDASLDTNKTRRSFSPVPYAKNSDKLDSRHAGFDPGNVPYVKEDTGMLPENIIPGGTNLNTFILDKDGDAAANDTLALQFGGALAKTLSWNGMLDQFEFNDTVSITGDLIVSGTINNVTFGPKPFIDTLTPEYPNSIFVADGSDNNGSMHEETETEAGNVHQMLRWETIQSSLQDYGVQIKYTLPTTFISFEETNPIALSYKTDGIDTVSKIDFTLEKEGALGTDQLQSAGIALSGNTWTTSEFALDDQTIWAAGDTLIFYTNLMASQNGDARISNLEIRYKTD